MKVIDIHIHGGFGISFDEINQSLLRDFALQAYEKGIAAFCPTLTGDDPEKLYEKISVINEIMQTPKPNEARVIGVHLEGTFLSAKKSGIQNSSNFMPPSIENFKKIAKNLESAIKIVVIAPEYKNSDLIKYLKSNDIKVHFGHTIAKTLEGADGVCHLYNAMEALTHKCETMALKALLSETIYTELIADTIHVHPDMLKLTFKVRPCDKIILISDALAIAGSKLDFITFCGKKILKNGHDEKGTLAGSAMLLPDIVSNLIKKEILSKEIAQKMAYANPLDYLKISLS
ncbi:MAG: hypothetical protein LUE64_06725 [Candidatus Gastranaerophilales bacterium]|nr:hypothetical protein [Candidatus Gastranaerophilales bacterium]